VTHRRRLLLRYLLVIGVALVAALLLTKPFAGEPYRVELVLEDASGLRVNGDVKVRGVRAGRIEAIDLDSTDRAHVTARLFDGVGAVGSGARAQSRPTGPLGETYVDLELGDAADPQPSGATIPLADTGRYVGLDQVFDMFDAPTRARLRILVNEAGVALAGRGSDLNRLLAALPPSLSESRDLLAQVRARNRDLRRLIGSGDRVLAAVHPERDELGGLVSAAARTLEATASQRQALGESVEEAPGALRQLSETLETLGSAASALRPTARRLRSSARPLSRTLAALPSFERRARPLLRSATEVAPTIESFARRSAPILDEVTTVGAELASFARSLRPVLEVLDAGGTGKLLRWFDGFGQIAERSDSLGHFIRLGLSVDTRTLDAAIDRYLGKGAGAPGGAGSGEAGGGDPAPGGEPAPGADPAKGEGPPAPAAGSTAPSTAPPAAPAPRGSIDDLLDFLLGP